MTTKHTHVMVFGRRVAGCARCAELAAGAMPVAGWGAARKRADAQRLVWIREHNCKTAGCGPICTAFDW